MSHFARVENNIVVEVLAIEQDVIDSGLFGTPDSWVQTSYNTFAGKHRLNGTPLRKNYAGIGYIYDKDRDAFYVPKPFDSWILNEETCLWESPIPMPSDGKHYQWDEETLSWVEISI